MRSTRPSKDSTRNRLYVEGADDFHVVCALVHKSGVAWSASDSRIPHAPYSDDGVIVVEGDRRVGVWMMPYGGQPGAVEAFLPMADALVCWFRALYLS